MIGPTVFGSADAAWKIRESLYRYEEALGASQAFGSRAAYIVDLPHRRSFCPDVSWYTADPETTEFLVGSPAFAAEIRDPGEYGDEAERRIAAKRADYFAAGSQVVWDVDVLREGVVRVYRTNNPDQATVYRRGDTAEAERAVPGWTLAVDDPFR